MAPGGLVAMPVETAPAGAVTPRPGDMILTQSGHDRAPRMRVRAEHDPERNGRVCGIAYTVANATATCSGIAKVSAPRERHHRAVDDDARSWDSVAGAQVVP
jgi:hypothetical protein